MSRHPGPASRRRRRTIGHVAVATLFVALVALAIVAVGDGDTCPGSRSLAAFALVAAPPGAQEPPEGTTVIAPGVPELAVAVARRLDEGTLPASRAQTTDVQVSRFLEVHARVMGFGGRPVPGTKVVFAWYEGGDVSFDTALADNDGIARVMRWIAPQQRGKRTVLVVSASRGIRSASAYTWFVPE